MSDKFALILLIADMSATLNAAVKVGKLKESDSVKIEHANGISTITVGELLDHANERLGEFGFIPVFGEVQNG